MSFQKCRVVDKGVSPSAYHAAQTAKRGTPEFVMSPSSLKAFAALPSRWVHGWEPPDSKAKQWGDLLDCRLLTPSQFETRFAVEPAEYPDTGMKCPLCGSITDAKSCRKCKTDRIAVTVMKPWRYGAEFTDAWKAAHVVNNINVVSKPLLERCDAAAARLREVVDGDDTILRWFDCCDNQVLVEGEWRDEATGLVIPVRCLQDFVPRIRTEFAKCLGDLKSTRSAHPIKFQRQAFDFGWHIQAAFDLDLYTAATGEDRNTWCFIIQENYEPWECNRAMYGQESGMGQPGFIELGRDARYGGYQGILSNYCACLKSGKWPRYNDTDESAQGGCNLTPEPFMADKMRFAPQYSFESDAEADAPEVNTDDTAELIP